MREIKFRLIKGDKIVGYEKWYGGYQVEGDPCSANPCWLYSKDNEHWNPTYIHHKIKNQYTGLKDKNGKEIWEGDIVKFTKREVSILGYYVYKAPSFYIEQITEAKYQSTLIPEDYIELTFYDEMGDNFCRLDIEIIGNIYSNPELLEGK